MMVNGTMPTSLHGRFLATTKRLMPCIATTNEVKGVGIPGWKAKLAGSGLLPIRLPRIRPEQTQAVRDSLQTDNQIGSLRDFERYLCCIEAQCQLSELTEGSKVIAEAISNQLSRVAFGLDQTRSLFSKYSPSVALVAQGYRFESALIRQIAIEKNVPLVAIENTAFRDRFLWDCLSGITTNFNLSKNYYWRWREHVNPEDVSSYIQSLVENTRTLKRPEHESPVSSCGMSDRPYLLFLGQVYTDSAVLFGLGNWQSPEAFIAAVMEEGHKRNMDVVIKLHPKETNGSDPVCNRPYDRLTFRKLSEHPSTRTMLDRPGVIVDRDNRFDTYDLIDNAALAITLTSQSGLEAAFRGIPTIVGGPAFYAGLGFTHEASDEATLETAVSRALLQSRESHRTEQAQRFAYIHFEKYCLPKTFKALRDVIRFAKAEPCR